WFEISPVTGQLIKRLQDFDYLDAFTNYESRRFMRTSLGRPHGLWIVLFGPGGLIRRTLNVHHELNAAFCRLEIMSITELFCRFQQHLDVAFRRAIIERVIRSVVRKAVMAKLIAERIPLRPGAILVLS